MSTTAEKIQAQRVAWQEHCTRHLIGPNELAILLDMKQDQQELRDKIGKLLIENPELADNQLKEIANIIYGTP